ncbi:MAG: heparan-alpha-glucosaminide N-acetyltransferase [Miniphocaeibacter sp.]|uniref:heparan-alpha-glucosaminide N-acetyltransferase n=1 Tax=Miniphocaeibacter sp. TaxID=3100973 RepID=UPI0017E60543|nr:DUF1624 domain-containing protein [Gallicola sp.]
MKERYNSIDFIRGFAIINMVIYHLCYDLVYIFGESISWFPSKYSSIWQNLIAMTFIVTSGISYNFGKKHSRKFTVLLICAAILSVFTVIFMKDQFIAFGIIHFFAFATLILLAIDPILKKINPFIGIVLFILLFIATKPITSGYINLFFTKYYLPEKLYNLKFLFWLGFPSSNFTSADYFPILPWIFLFIVGFYIGRLIVTKKPIMKKKRYNPICIIGRHSLFIYMVHQPIIYLILSYIYKTPLF